MNMGKEKRFWTGIGLISLEALGIAAIGLSRLPSKTLMIVGGVSAFVVYNGIAGLLIWSGSSNGEKKKEDDKGKKKK